MKNTPAFLSIALLFGGILTTSLANPLKYAAPKEIARGRHIVLIASDHEYRSEETIPALARILAKHHGFDCTVLFGIDPETGAIEPGRSHIPGLEALETADVMVIFARFQALPDEQMKHIDAYLNRGGPVVSLRTSTHAFKYPKDSPSPYRKYDFQYSGEDYLKGFGHQVTGQTWVGHYGKNHQQSTRIEIVPQKKDHPILRGVKDPWVHAGGYNAEPAADWDILTMAQPLMSMEPEGEPDPEKPPMAGEWTRTYQGKDGKTGRCFTSLYGASEDILNDGYRRMLVNAVYWAAGLEDQIRADSPIDFVGPYKPNTFTGREYAAGVKPSAYEGFESPIPAHNNVTPRQKPDAQPKKNSAAAPASSKPNPAAKPAPFAFRKDDRVVLIGNALAERMQHHGWLETLIQKEKAGEGISFRNLGFSGDQVARRPRNKDFTSPEDYLKICQADVIFAFFGYNESFEDDAGLDRFKDELGQMVDSYRQLKPNGKTEPRIVLFSPIAHENLNDPNLPDGQANNARLGKYTRAIREVASDRGAGFVDLFTPSRALYEKAGAPLTINGIHLTEEGNRLGAEVIAEQLLGKKVAAGGDLGPLRQAVLDKNWHWFHRYRATDGNDIWGSRSVLQFVDGQTNAEVLQRELTMLDVMTANRDTRIQALARGVDIAVDDSNVPKPVPVTSNVGGGSKSSSAVKEGNLDYVSGEEGLKHLAVPEGFKANLFADESMFPELVNPVQMQVDGRGRLWVSSWKTYPKWEPHGEMDDRLLILPDENRDGVADRAITFAKVHNPLGFEFWNGGVLVASAPDILFLKDTDGDDVADVRIRLLHGLGSADTHHAANNLIYGPDGGIYWQSGIFLHNNFEHPWGSSLSTGASAMYRFDPRRFTISYHAANSPNPHGISFDYWGYHYATDGTGGRAYQVRPEGSGFAMFPLLEKEVRPVPASEIVSSANFPDEMQQDFLICNTIGFLGIKQYRLDRDGGAEISETAGKGKDKKTVTRQTQLGEVWGTPDGAELTVMVTDPATGEKTPMTSRGFLLSGDKNFRPTDALFGEDGALYVSDWHNVIIGHMQHNIRDPNRDHQHGRVYRVVNTRKPLQKPVGIAGAGLPELLDNLKNPVDGVRQRTRVELSARDSKAVIAATRKWLAQFDPKKREDAHHLLEALWVHQQHNRRDKKLLNQLLNSPEPHARMAALTVQHHWFAADPTKGMTPVPETTEEKIEVEIPEHLPKEARDLFTLGSEVFHRDAHCVTCHQPNGEGLANVYPPLKGSPWVTGSEERIIKLALNGLWGPIEVNGVKYDASKGVPPMTPFAALLNDQELAGVLTFVRNHWGNQAPAVEPETVTKVRAATKDRTTFWSPEELLKMHPLE